MLSKSNLLVLDEPTNHLDIPSREALEEAILSYDGTLIVISHDRYFLNKVINRILELQEDGVSEYLGNYTYYTFFKSFYFLIYSFTFSRSRINFFPAKILLQFLKRFFAFAYLIFYLFNLILFSLSFFV